MSFIPFNKPYSSLKEMQYIMDALERGKISGDGYYTQQCHDWFLKHYGCHTLLTHSCTAALEMSALLLNLQVGDEVIMPSYTFVSTANAFVLRGAVPVFVDIHPQSLNIDAGLIESAITPKTKAICVVHYAGVSCDMEAILDIAKRHGLAVIEDAAQGFGATYQGKPLGTLGDLGTLSFHETKNVISGEGGALLINDERLLERAEIIREKGTNRSRFFRGQVDKYTWVDVGSSFLPSDLVAAFLYAQLESSESITQKRLALWQAYHDFFEPYEAKGLLQRPVAWNPTQCQHNAHMYYILLPDLEIRQAFIAHLKANEILSTFHYIPLHSSPAGLRYGRSHGELTVSNRISDTLVRLPLFYELSSVQMAHIFDIIENFFQKRLFDVEKK